MARKTIRISDQSGREIPDGKGASVRITHPLNEYQESLQALKGADVPDVYGMRGRLNRPLMIHFFRDLRGLGR
jgi:hypothetical protein